ncbi:MAG: glycoside hydrolase family 3, partial [Actinotalea sp.]|nr:glycoside hydrolase family 3 [Actinotalea sp.]
GVNMKRSPLCGRNFEYFSEDPYLTGELASAFVVGVQSEGVGTSLKHFAANNQETDRRYVSADVDERTLREIYLPAFERVVTQAQPWTVMCSYNKINGVYSAENRWLLTEVLRDQWGFGGLVMSDWDAVNLREDGVLAGLDLEMPTSNGVGQRRILDAVAVGTLSESDVDRCAERVLELVARAQRALGPDQPADLDAHHTLAREAAVRSAVLLKNDGDLLPLARTGGAVAVIGEMARTPRYQGAGSSLVVPTRLDDPLAALRLALDGAREVTFAPGYEVEADAVDPDLLAEAVERARAADVVVLFLGLPPSYESEGYDRRHMDLPAHQLELLDAVVAANADVVVVLANGAPVTLEPWQARVRALLEGWLLGQAGGGAVADLLLGDANPSGRLAETLPLRHAHTPAVGAFPGEHGHVRYGEGLLIGYRWYDTRDLDVAYPFGHGLSYTTFAWSDLTAQVHDDGPDVTVDVSVTVTNTGTRSGQEVVQVYVHDPECSVFRPEQELKGFTTVALEPGDGTRVTVRLGPRAFAWWHDRLDRWVVEQGAFEIRVGASSRDIRATHVVRLAAQDVVEPLSPEVPLAVWLDHPVAGPRLRRLMTTQGAYDDHRLHRMRENPVARVARMPGFPVPAEELDRLSRDLVTEA